MNRKQALYGIIGFFTPFIILLFAMSPPNKFEDAIENKVYRLVFDHTDIVDSSNDAGIPIKLFITSTQGASATSIRYCKNGNCSDQHLLTGQHVCENSYNFKVYDRRQLLGSARVVRESNKADLCLLSINFKLKGSFFNLNRGLLQDMFKKVYTAGYPYASTFGLKYVYTGVVSDYDVYKREEWRVPELFLSASTTALPGMSGGVVINENGDFLGIISLQSFGGFGTMFVPAYEVKKFLEETL